MRTFARIELAMGVGGLYCFSGLAFCAAYIGNWYSTGGCVIYGWLMTMAIARARRKLARLG